MLAGALAGALLVLHESVSAALLAATAVVLAAGVTARAGAGARRER